jgi:hypothetical protein
MQLQEKHGISQIIQKIREKIEAMDLFKVTHLIKLELLSNAATIDSALSYIRSRQQGQGRRQHYWIQLATTMTN